MENYSKLLLNTIELAKQAGAYQLSNFRCLPPGRGEQKSVRELVSYVDIETEKILMAGLRTLLPDAGIFAEESGVQGQKSLLWIIDPLDGTTNYLSGLDQFSLSIALVAEKTPVLGVVYRPISKDIFAAVLGKGFIHNDQEIKPHTIQLNLQDALIGTGFPYRSQDLQDNFFACAREVLNNSRGIRRMGSAALDLSYVAAGYLQGFWETDLQPYDVAAALLFMKESGCLVTDERGKDYDMFSHRTLVCGFPSVHRQLSAIVGKHYQNMTRKPLSF